MSNHRFTALHDLLKRQPQEVVFPEGTVSDYYGENVFNASTMREYLTDGAYKSLLGSMKDGTRL